MIIKNGKVLDMQNGYQFSKLDIRIKNGIINEIEKNITPQKDEEIIDAEKYIIAPGFIDIHTHVYNGKTVIGIDSDIIGVYSGVSTVIDAGTSGADNFQDFYDRIIKKSKTRIFSFLNVASCGLETLQELNDLSNIDSLKIKEIVKKYKEYIVGIKVRASASVVGKNDIKPIKMAKDIATELELPLMVHIGNAPPKVEDVLNLLGKGDIVTHCYHDKDNNLLRQIGIIPEALAARKRGVLFDIGHGSASFSFDIGKKAFKENFKPDFISTDLYEKNIDTPVKSQIETLNKAIYLGLSIEEGIEKLTTVPTHNLNLGSIGSVKVGYKADFTILELINDSRELIDSVNNKVLQKPYLEAIYTIVNGEVYKVKK